MTECETARNRVLLERLFWAGVKDVRGEASVAARLRSKQSNRPTKILATGKAAASMYLGVPADWRTTAEALVVTKDGHGDELANDPQVKVIEAGHPVPNAQSLLAGDAALTFVSDCTASDRLLFLVSGGSSSLVEVPIAGLTLPDIQQRTEAMLAQDRPIQEINQARKQMSQVKGGRLLSHFSGAEITVLALSDVEGDQITDIGSGIGAADALVQSDYSCEIIGSNAIAREAAAKAALSQGLRIVQNAETLYERVDLVAEKCAQEVLAGPSGLYVFGGEPTVVLPDNPGAGGRNQALALEFAAQIQGHSGISALFAGTDGTDGKTSAAGGFSDGDLFLAVPGASHALETANSAKYLQNTGYQFCTGPTGTNVMDLALILKL